MSYSMSYMTYMSLFATEHWNWDTWTGEDQEGYGEEEYDGEAYDESGAHCEDEGFIVSQLHFYTKIPVCWTSSW